MKHELPVVIVTSSCNVIITYLSKLPNQMLDHSIISITEIIKTFPKSQLSHEQMLKQSPELVDLPPLSIGLFYEGVTLYRNV